MGAERRPLQIELPPAPAAILRRLHEAGHPAYAVGGAVRDALLGRPAHDVDIATAAPVDRLRELFPRHHEVGTAFGVLLVVQDGLAVEVATFRHESGYEDGRRPSVVGPGSLEEDAARRDFTVNALYYDPAAGELLDLHGGTADLEAGILRCIGDPAARFGEDHLRQLRAVRLAAQLDLCIEAATWEALRASPGAIRRISAERQRDELEKLLLGPRPALGLRMLLYSGLLRELLPEVEAMVGVAQPPQFHPEGDVFVHTQLVLEALERRTRPLVWGALLHDVGKPPTFAVAERIRFDGHVEEGARMADGILRRLRLDNDTRERVVALVAQHLRFKDVREMRRSTRLRFLGQPHFDDHLTLHRADCMGCHGDLSLAEFCEEQLEEIGREQLRPSPLLRGRELLAMGFEPGPRVGEILAAVEEAQLSGELADAAAARAYVLERWSPERGSAN